MTATIEETDLSTFEEIPAPCDYPDHDEHGDGPAVWAITLRPAPPCGCPRSRFLVLLCEGCWAFMNSRGGQLYCRTCWGCYHINEDIVSVVRL